MTFLKSRYFTICLSIAISAILLLVAMRGAANAQFAQGRNQPRVNIPVLVDWNGPYVGVAAGLSAVRMSGISSLSSLTSTYSANGVQGSLIAGTNLHLGPVVIGVEGDVTLQNITGSRAEASGVLTTKIDWVATLRARLGLPVANLLFYGTAGLAVTNVGLSYQNTSRDSQFLKGWVAGVGLEAAILGDWRVRGEYLYSKADSTRFNFASGPSYSSDSSTHVVRAAIVLRFSN